MLRHIAPVVLVVTLATVPVRAQSISTIAGGGSDDGRLATSVGLFGVRGLALDRSGGLLITEQSNNTIRRVDLATGTITTLAGNGGAGFAGDGGPASFATLGEPRSVAVDAAGNVYLSDRGTGQSGRVRRINAQTGIITTVAGGGPDDSGTGDGGPAINAFLRDPYGVAVTAAFLYISDAGYDGQRIRRVDLASGIITTIAGNGTQGFSGDNGPASLAQLSTPLGIATDPDGHLFIADFENSRIRRIDAVTGIITTVAGGGTPSSGNGDGGAATSAALIAPTAVAFDPAGNMYITSDDSVRRVDRVTGIIATIAAPFPLPFGIAVANDGTIYVGDNSDLVERAVPPSYEHVVIAGGGSFIGDGLTATAAILRRPHAVAADRAGNVYIADSVNWKVRRVDRATGVITTVAGNGVAYSDDVVNLPATEVAIGFPVDVAVDPAGRFFLIADQLNGRVWRVDTASGILTLFAGSGSPADGVGDGGAATSARVVPYGVTLGIDGFVYIADGISHRVRRVDSQGTITTIAGSGPLDGEGSFAGDGGPATAARLSQPRKAVADGRGNVYISDSANGLIRRIDSVGIITTFAGRFEGGETLFDDVPATESNIGPSHIAIGPDGDLFIADGSFHRIRRVDAQTNIISTVAGSAIQYIFTDFAGDGGPARAAKLNFGFDPAGVFVNQAGDVLFTDTDNNRVRAVFACVDVASPQLISPADGATGVGDTTLSWNAVPGAFRYDLYLDTTADPTTVVASDLAVTSFAPANLQRGTRYSWKVVAKGDPYCRPESASASAVRTFTLAGTCVAPPPFTLQAPADGATGVPSTVLLSWSSAGSATYDVFLGTSRAPALVAEGLTSMSFVAEGLAPGTTWTWLVVARSTCDSTRTTTTASRTFTVAGSCTPPGPFALLDPLNGATDIATDVPLSWSSSTGASSYDVYLGGDDPPLFAPAVAATRLRVSGLVAGRLYSWRVVARVSCDPALSATTPVSRFTVSSACDTPSAPRITFVPLTEVATGRTYVIAWSESGSLGDGGGYVIERSRSSSFAPLLDSQFTMTTSASFVSNETGVVFHRVQAIAGCDPSRRSPYSEVRAVTVVAGQPNVVFTKLPGAVITALGEKLEQRRTDFFLENLGSNPVELIVGRSEIDSVPFFSIVDPEGTGGFVTLPPRKPKRFEVRFSGPPNDVAGSYQGIIFAASTGQGLGVTPYAFVNLKVGGGDAATPRFFVNGVAAEYAFFPGLDGGDASRSPITIEIRNPGTGPMELAAEIGPEVWLRPEDGWNAAPIAPGGVRAVRLFTQRNRAPNGSALPRYTYFTVRTRDGGSARLLVQDNGTNASVSGRTPLAQGRRAWIVPDATSRDSSGGARAATRLRIGNTGSEALQIDLVFTPSNTDGFDATLVRTATVVVPPNDVVTLTDPLAQIFGLESPAVGQIEVRASGDRAGALTLDATTVVLATGETLRDLPVLGRGEGAIAGQPHVVHGVSARDGVTTRLVLVETTGAGPAQAVVTLFDASGARIGETAIEVPRYGQREIDSLVSAVGGAPGLTGGRLTIRIDGGGGTVSAVIFTTSSATGHSASFTGRDEETLAAKSVLVVNSNAPSAVTTSWVVPVGVNGPITPSNPTTYQTMLGLSASPSGPATVTVGFVSAAAAAPVRTITVEAGKTIEFQNALVDLFGLPAGSKGTISVQASSTAAVYAAVARTPSSGQPSVSASIPVFSSATSFSTGASYASQTPLYADGLDQSTDPVRGNQWIVLLNEMSGHSGVVNVRLYEAGNRSQPIADKDVPLGARQQVTLDSLFSVLGLESADRKKDRTNVLCVITARSGSARVAATALAIDQRTGEVRSQAFATSGSPAASGVTTIAPIPVPLRATRKRAVERG